VPAFYNRERKTYSSALKVREGGREGGREGREEEL